MIDFPLFGKFISKQELNRVVYLLIFLKGPKHFYLNIFYKCGIFQWSFSILKLFLNYSFLKSLFAQKYNLIFFDLDYLYLDSYALSFEEAHQPFIFELNTL
jgi:hypothetical protein